MFDMSGGNFMRCSPDRILHLHNTIGVRKLYLRPTGVAYREATTTRPN